jgi:DNA-directed RNA polymerase subunit RPC12/RpoP
MIENTKIGSSGFACPGSAGIKDPTLELVPCGSCGTENEIFTDENSVLCENCGKIVLRSQDPSCIDWCKYAKECIGDEKYNELKGGK